MEEKETAYNWFIPSIHELLDKNSKVNEMHVTIDSAFQVQLNFTKKDALHLHVLPLITISEFKFSTKVWLNDPHGEDASKINSYNNFTVEHSETTVECLAPRRWINCRKFGVSDILRNKKCECCGLAAGMNIELNFRYENKIPKSSNISDSLQDDLEQLFTTGNVHDAVIKTNEGKEFKVHKMILATRCEVLSAAFQHETIEAATNIVDSPFDDETMENLLLFLYCGKTPNIHTIAEKLLVAADYYQLSELKDQCAQILIEQLTKENAVQRLELAQAHSCTHLEDGALIFCNKQNVSGIIQSEGWQNANVDILKKISEHITRRYLSDE